ncbi:MAG: SAM-dependent DNA methyltransferase [Candidatus Zixiibacteriota bacterium]|nr:MAG: SAM-dependent DNA methyltransferase [candidate division Zixibacteria bacterium]
MSSQLNRESTRYLKETDLSHRKSLGQYFTPKDVRLHLLSRLPRKKGASILDPSCGSGEFLLSAGEYFPGGKLHGWEIDPKLVRLSRKALPRAEIVRGDSLERDCLQRFDFVIGNPPYFEFKPEPAVRNRYREVISGRANIFSMFVKLGLNLLRPGGYLAYVIPPSLNNGAYFAGLRSYIIEHANIEHLEVLKSSSLFHRAQQMVMIMVLRKTPNRGDHVFSRGGLTIFSSDAEKLSRAFRGKKTLRQLGFTVRTGRVVWNQHRTRLTHSPRRGITLIWAHNITADGLMLGNATDKPQYIKTDKYDIGPAIVVNRVTGAAGRARLKAALIEDGVRFVGENHVNVIYPPPGGNRKTSLSRLEKIASQISSPEASRVMQLVTGNTQVSRTELERLLPLDV